MKPSWSFLLPLFLMCTVLLIAGCKKPFNQLYQKAAHSFQEKNYVDVIDTVNLGLTRWQTSDGVEEKGQAYLLLGKSYLELRKSDKAAEAFREAVKFSSNTFEAAYNLGLLYLTAGQAREALVSFQDALRMKKNDPFALIGLGNTYFSLKDYKAAQAMYQQVLDTSPGVKEAREYLAITEQKLRPHVTVLKLKRTVTTSGVKKAPAKKTKGRMRIKKG
jgi:tetratricopeptide (TPR) repeat protein